MWVFPHRFTRRRRRVGGQSRILVGTPFASLLEMFAYLSLARLARSAFAECPADASADVIFHGDADSGADANAMVAAVAAVLAVGLGLRLAALAGARPLSAGWVPGVAGLVLGGIVASSEVLTGHALGASGPFNRPAALWFETSEASNWTVWLLVGVLGGSFASASLSGTLRPRWMPDAEWEAVHGPSRARRLAVAFSGSLIAQIGANIAGGCTSGLAISGGVVLGAAAFLFMAGMFAGGIPTAWLWSRRFR